MKTKRKFRFFYNYEREEAWLDEMARKGWKFIGRSLFGLYRFEETPPQDLNFRIDYRYIPGQTELLKYLQLFQDSGWQHVYGDNSGFGCDAGCKYFVSTSADASEDIFSDASSKAQRYRRQCKYHGFVILITMFLLSYGFSEEFTLLVTNPLALFFGPAPNLTMLTVRIFYSLLFLSLLVTLVHSLYYAIRSFLSWRQLNKEAHPFNQQD